MPFLSPQIINARHPFPHLENGALYVVVRLNDEAERQRKKEAAKAKADKDGKADKAAVKEAKKAKNLGAEGVTLGLVPMPRQCERVIALPGKGKELAVRPAGARHRDGGGRDILHVHREAHERHLRHPQRRPRCHRGLRRGRRGLPRAHEAHPEEALAPGPRAPGKRAAAVDHAGEAAAEAPEPQGRTRRSSTSVPLDMGYTFALAARLPAKRARGAHERAVHAAVAGVPRPQPLASSTR